MSDPSDEDPFPDKIDIDDAIENLYVDPIGREHLKDAERESNINCGCACLLTLIVLAIVVTLVTEVEPGQLLKAANIPVLGPIFIKWLTLIKENWVESWFVSALVFLVAAKLLYDSIEAEW